MTLVAIVSTLIAGLALWLLIRHRLRRTRAKQLRRNSEIWSIGLYAGPDPVTLAPHPDIANPILTAKEVTDIPARFVADPFMIRQNGEFFLFFEVLNEKRNSGEIGFARSRDLKKWRYGGIVLRERFHLSYPYVFEHDGRVYMIPECAKSNAVRLYRATSFPEKWEYLSSIITGRKRYSPLFDPSIVRHNGQWYLFSYARKLNNLHLFTASDLTGKWTEHPASPVVTESQSFARPGGRIVSHEGNLYRYAQDGLPRYGSKAWAFRITELTPRSYREEPCTSGPVIAEGPEPWHNAGMHTVDAHQMENGSWIAIVDGLEDRRIFSDKTNG
jgi:hemin uptake protein HemP